MPEPEKVVTRTRIVREGEIRVRESEDEDKPKRLEITVATENPVRVWGADEILSMKRGAVDLTRFRNNAPFLANHRNEIGSILGRIEKPRIEARELRAEVVLAENQQADEYRSLVEQGMANKISVGFRVDKWELAREGSEDEAPAYEAVRWTPVEASAVAVPADDGAAVTGMRIERVQATEKDFDMPTTETKPAGEEKSQPAQPSIPTIDREAVIAEERKRVISLEDYGKQFESVGGPDLAADAVRNGGTLDDLKAAILERHEKRWKEGQKEGNRSQPEDVDLGLTRADVQNFSFVRAVAAMANGSMGRSVNCHEMDVMRSAAERTEKANARPVVSGFTIPAEVLHSRVMYAATGAGDNLVAETLRPDSFIELLRANAPVMARTTMFGDLVGDVDVPRQTSGTTAHWRGEADNASAVSDIGTDQITLSPKELISGVSVSRRFLSQSTPDGEMLLRQDMAEQQALAIDLAILLGSGTAGQPDGVFGRSAADQDVAAPTAVTHAAVVALETKLAENNALRGNLAYVSAPAQRQTAKTTALDAGSGLFVYQDGTANGYPWEITTQIPATFNSATASTGGNKKAIFFGNWADVLTAQWAGVDIVVNPFTNQMQARTTISMHQMMDVALRHNESIVYNRNIT